MPTAWKAGAGCLVGTLGSGGRREEGVRSDSWQLPSAKVKTCGETTSAVKSDGYPGRPCSLLVSSWAKLPDPLQSCLLGSASRFLVMKVGGARSIQRGH